MAENEQVAELIADVRERILFLQEIGVTDLKVDLEVLDERIKAAAQVPRSQAAAPPPSAAATPQVPPIPKVDTPKPARTPGSRLASLPSLKDLTPDLPDTRKVARAVEVIPERADVTETVPEIHAEIGPQCVRCKLSQLGRSKVVNSTGNFEADLMFVGEAPGADEDEQGEPFVGRAGKLLTDIMNAIGFDRSDVFIGNINRCRPPKNRAPEPDESAVCKPFLEREIAVVKPKVIVVLGATAAQNLLDTKVPIGKLRGNFHDYRGTKVMPTFHPAYLLRDPHKKREVWDDMKKVRDFLQAN